jgi:hypothetical protein
MLPRLFGSLAVVAFLSCSGSAPPPAEKPAEAEPAPADSASPPAASQAAPQPEAPPPTADENGQPDYEVEEITKIRECDEYLALYRFCEPRLKDEIMAGDRRTYKAERASLEYFLSTPERASMPDACADMLHALEKDCLTR